MTPTSARETTRHARRCHSSPGLGTLGTLGALICTIEISKPKGAEYGVGEVVRCGPTFTPPAPVDILSQAEWCGAVLVALADRGSCVSRSVYDVIELAPVGTPAVAIATEPLVPEAQEQACALAMPEQPLATVPHSVQLMTSSDRDGPAVCGSGTA